jgi:hypothetical protein
VGNDRPVRRETSFSVMTGRSCSECSTRSIVAAPRPAAWTRAASSLNSATSRCAVSTALVAVATTPSRKKSSQDSQSPVARTRSSSR